MGAEKVLSPCDRIRTRDHGPGRVDRDSTSPKTMRLLCGEEPVKHEGRMRDMHILEKMLYLAMFLVLSQAHLTFAPWAA